MKEWTVDKAVQWAQLALLVIGIAGWAATCSRTYDRIENHEKRLGEIELSNKAAAVAAVTADKELSKQLVQLQKSIDYATWRIDGVSKDLDKATTGKATKR
ncbi:MAG TPA: hypothetical protein VJ793_27305 [Anaerolineae bacterium]|nr:hypothetical protein [Anaerolineae bacterium]